MRKDPFKIIEGAAYVMGRSQHVSIDHGAISRFVKVLKDKPQPSISWDLHYHYKGPEEKTLLYLLVLDTLNFCFWTNPGQERWSILYKDELVSGYWALAASLKMAMESNVPLWDPWFLKELRFNEFKHLLGGRGSLPLLEERYIALVELGEVLIEEFKGSGLELIRSAQGSAVKLVRLMTTLFSSYKDEAILDGIPVPFYKRAQILAWDIYSCFQGKGIGNLEGIGELTAFSDYKLPQVLRELDILIYSEELSKTVDSFTIIPSKDPMELEIRAATIMAVEYIRQGLESHGVRITSPEIDQILWHMGQMEEYRKRPYHRTLSIYY